MYAYIGLSGMIGFVVCIVILVVAIIKKKSKKKSIIGLAITFTIFIVGVATTPMSTTMDRNNDTVSVVADSSAESTEKSKNPTSSEPLSTTTARSTTVLESTTVSDTKGVISGLLATDIKLNLENWGIQSKTPVASSDTDDYIYQSSVIDSDTGANLLYYITSDSSFNVKHVTFSIANLAVISQSDFNTIARGYLGFCATVPYDGSDPAKAKKWVEDNIAKCNEVGKIKTLEIGGVEFSLYGNGNGSRFLEINPVK